MASYPLAALAIRPSTFDPVGVLQTAASLQGQQTQNELARLRMSELSEQMREMRDRRGALDAFRTSGGMSNPAALSALSGHPDLFTSVQGALTAQQQQQLQANARAAYRVMAFPEDSPERTAAWREELENARREGRLPPGAYERYASLDQPPQRLLESLVRQAQAIPTELQSAHADLYRQQVRAAEDKANMDRMIAERFGFAPPSAPRTGGRAPLSVRTNNPGAITMGPFARAQGAAGATPDAAGNPVARFESPEQGAAAMFRRLATGSYVGIPLSEALGTWQTGRPDGANPGVVNLIAQRAGLSPHTPITPELLASPQGIALARAMAQHEAGRPSPLTDAQWLAGQNMAFGRAGPAQPQDIPGVVVDMGTAPPQTATTPSSATSPSPPARSGALSLRETIERLPEAQQLAALGLAMKRDWDGLAKLLNEADGSSRAPAGFEWVDRRDKSKGLRAIPGGPAEQLAGEIAGRMAFLDTGIARMPSIRRAFEREWGVGDHFAHQMSGPLSPRHEIPALSGEIGQARRDVRMIVEAALRALTGAAAPEPEVERYTTMFTPGATDSIESAKSKIDALAEFAQRYRAIALAGRSSNPASLTVPPPGPRTEQPPPAPASGGGYRVIGVR